MVMLGTYVPDQLTVVTFDEAAEALRAGLRAETGKAPPEDVQALALAKTALEVFRFKSMHLWNFGNIKQGEQDPGMYTCFACGEELSTGSYWFEPDGRIKHNGVWSQPHVFDPPNDGGHPQTRFRAYANRFDGAYEYVSFLARGTRYRPAWQGLLSGDPHQFVHALKMAGYFTAQEAPYLAAVTSLWSEFRRRLRGIPVIEQEVDDGLPTWAELRAQVINRQFDIDNVIGRAA